MSKLLILLLFAVVLNEKLDGITVYDGEKLTNLMHDVATLNVNVGDEFYIRFSSYYPSFSTFISHRWSFVNYNEIPAALENFNKNGGGFKQEEKKNIMATTYISYYKFKALKTSYNEITLKFRYLRSSGCFGRPEDFIKNIKVNILSKK